jgi:3-hydroxybutyryl-CoA dehydrogenase
VKNITIIGAGMQGAMIAFRCALYKKNVTVFDIDARQYDLLYKKVDDWTDTLSTQKNETGELKSRINIRTALTEAVEECDLVIEAAPENLELKRKIWEQIDKAAPEKTIITTNSSSLRASLININVKRKDKTFNLNFAFPVEDDFVEVMWNDKTSEETKKDAVSFLKDINCYMLITQKEIQGFSINRVWRAIKKECLNLWANGYIDPRDFDMAYKNEWGVEIGPFELMDKVGLDVVTDIENNYYLDSHNPSDLPPEKLKQMVQQGKLGRKSGQGFYSYENKKC